MDVKAFIVCHDQAANNRVPKQEVAHRENRAAERRLLPHSIYLLGAPIMSWLKRLRGKHSKSKGNSSDGSSQPLTTPPVGKGEESVRNPITVESQQVCEFNHCS